MLSSILCLLLAAPGLAAEPVGTFGASVDLAEGWKRDPIAPSLGKDQFHDKSGLYMAITELRGPFLDAEDVRRRLKLQTVGFETQAGKPLTEASVDTRGGVLHAEQQWALKLKGHALVYDVHLFARGGLGYLVLTWSVEKQALQLRRHGKQLARRFLMPGSGSAWDRLTTPVVSENEVAGHEVHFAYSPALFEPLEKAARSDAFAGLSSADQAMSAYFLLERSEDGAESLLDGGISGVSSLAVSVDRTERFDGTIDGRPARFAVIEGKAAGAPFSGAVAVVPAGEGVFLDVRFVSYGAFASRRALWDGLVASIDIVDRPVVDAFPVVDVPTPPTPLTAHQQGLLEAAHTIGEAPSGTAWRLSGTDLYAEGYRGVEVLSLADGTTRTLSIGEGRKALLPAARPDGLYVPALDGDVVRQVDGKGVPAGFTAARLADAGARGLLVVRAPAPRDVPGFARLVAPTGQRVLLRADSGEERVLADLHGPVVSAMAVAGDEALLVLSAPGARFGTAELTVLGLADGALHPRGVWQSLESVAPGDDGWIVTGAPDDGTAGVYRLARTGERTLLLSGRHTAALPLDDGDLLLLTRWHPPGAPAATPDILALRVPAAALAAHGPRFDPFTAAHVQQVAHAVLGTLGLLTTPTNAMSDPTAIRRFVEAASRASEARVGVPLPRDAEGIDRLLGEAQGDAALDEEGYVLLTALLSDHLLAQGATWAGGRPPAGPVFGYEPDPENDHALGYQPLEVVRSTLQDSEGWWRPATTIRDERDGRALFIGVDPDAIRARVAATERPGVDALVATGKVTDLVAWLAVEPTNAHLRDDVYTRLAAAGRVTDLVAVSEPFRGKGPPAFADVRAHLAGRVAQATAEGRVDPLRYPALVADLRAAIAAHPGEGALYVLLAHVYEQGPAPDGRLLAAACWHHVDEELGWTPFDAEVTAAIARLEGKK